jgi:hypothetical protein
MIFKVSLQFFSKYLAQFIWGTHRLTSSAENKISAHAEIGKLIFWAAAWSNIRDE